MLTIEQLEMRRQGVGASEIGALLGVDPWKTAWAVWMDKLKEPEPVDNHHIRRGTYLEDGLRKWASEEIGLDFQPSETLRHPEHERILATPDGIHAEAVLEIKCPSPRNYWQWGEDDDVPDQYAAQLAQQMLVAGKPRGYLCVFLGDDIRVYPFARDESLERVIIGRINEFWTKHVEAQEPPPADWSRDCEEYIAGRFPEARAPRTKASSEADNIAQELLSIKQKHAELGKREKELKNQLALLCGDADGIDGHGWRLNYRTPKPRRVFDKDAAIEAGALTQETVDRFSREAKSGRRFDLRRVK